MDKTVKKVNSLFKVNNIHSSHLRNTNGSLSDGTAITFVRHRKPQSPPQLVPPVHEASLEQA